MDLYLLFLFFLLVKYVIVADLSNSYWSNIAILKSNVTELNTLEPYEVLILCAYRIYWEDGPSQCSRPQKFDGPHLRSPTCSPWTSRAFTLEVPTLHKSTLSIDEPYRKITPHAHIWTERDGTEVVTQNNHIASLGSRELLQHGLILGGKTSNQILGCLDWLPPDSGWTSVHPSDAWIAASGYSLQIQKHQRIEERLRSKLTDMSGPPKYAAISLVMGLDSR